MADILVLIHTLLPLIQLFDRLGAELLPGIRLQHILDEPLAEGIRQRGGLTSSDAARLWDHIKMAESIGARAVLVTCSTLSPLLDHLRPLTALPLVKIDEAMVVAAVQSGAHLGVLAINPAALSAVQQRLEAQAQQMGKEIACDGVLVQGAFEALLRGDAATHQRLVREAALDLSSRVDGLVLAQASMSGILDDIAESEWRSPVFASPRMALGQVRHLIGDLGWG